MIRSIFAQSGSSITDSYSAVSHSRRSRESSDDGWPDAIDQRVRELEKQVQRIHEFLNASLAKPAACESLQRASGALEGTRSSAIGSLDPWHQPDMEMSSCSPDRAQGAVRESTADSCSPLMWPRASESDARRGEARAVQKHLSFSPRSSVLRPSGGLRESRQRMQRERLRSSGAQCPEHSDCDSDDSHAPSTTSLILDNDAVHDCHSFRMGAEFAQTDSRHVVGSSVWEGAVIFLGLEGVPRMDTLLMLFAVALNVTMQIYLCVTVSGDTFVTDPFPTFEEMTRWRSTAGHSVYNVDPVSWTSLTSRVCHIDDSLANSEAEVSIVARLEQYTQPVFGQEDSPFSRGLLLSTFVVVLWSLEVWSEIWCAVSFWRALAIIERGSTTIVKYSDIVNETKFVLQKMSLKRMNFMRLVCTMRIFVALMFMVSGCRWLARTKDLEDLVLNVTALAFTLRVDEVLFETLVPLSVKVMVRRLHALRRDPIMMPAFQTDVGATVTSLYALAVMPLVMFVILLPAQEQMFRLKEAMCGGNQDFITAIVPTSGAIATTPTRPYSGAVVEASLYAEAVQEAVNSPMLGDGHTLLHLQKSTYMPSPKLFQLAQQRTVAYYANLKGFCQDADRSHLLGQSSHATSSLPTLVALTGRNGSACADFREHCSGLSMNLLRQLCPETCGCASPRSGLLPSSAFFGCPDACRSSAQYLNVLANKSDCEDSSLYQLQQDTGWHSYLEQLEKFSLLLDIRAKALHRRVSEGGCEAVAEAVAKLQGAHPTYQETAEARLLCPSSSIHGGLQWFCPRACGCPSGITNTHCPSACHV